MSANRVLDSVGFLVFSLAQVAVGQVVVELVPDNPGPYTGGEVITVDVWLHSSLPGEDPRLALIQFDFSQTDPNLSLAATFSFDYSSIPNASGYQERHPELPVPWTHNPLECVCSDAFLPLPPGGAVHIGSVGVRLPAAPGVYRLDALNATHPSPTVGQAGAIIYLHLGVTGFTGEITGGGFDFVVGLPPIPTMSGAALLVLAALLGSAGSWIAARRLRCQAQGFAKGKGGVFVHSSRVMTRTPGGPITPLVIGASLMLLGIARAVLAQPAPIPSQTVALNVDSGFVSATQGTDPVVVFSHLVQVQGAPWVRLHFGDVQLSGSPSASNESFLRITSEADGEVQVLDSSVLARWGNTSAYFNGEAVVIELFARVETGANRLLLEYADAGIQGELDALASICARRTIEFRLRTPVPLASCPQGVCGDCNGNGILDQCDLNCASPCGGCYVPGCGGSSDCNSNGIPDECDIASGTNPDCNNNGVPDECDIASGTSEDCEPNGVLDECERPRACYLPPGVPCIVTTQQCCSAVGGEFYPNLNVRLDLF